MHTIGRINKSIYSCITEDIVTDEVIITDNQLQHILDRHPEVYKEVIDYLNDIISAPDFIIKDKHKNTGLVVKRIKQKRNMLKWCCEFAHRKIMLDIKIRLYLVGK